MLKIFRTNDNKQEDSDNNEGVRGGGHDGAPKAVVMVMDNDGIMIITRWRGREEKILT